MFMVAFILVYKFMIQSTYYFFFFLFLVSIVILILIRKEHFYSIFFLHRQNELSVLNSRRMHNSLKSRFNVLKKLALLLLFFSKLIFILCITDAQ